MKTKKPILRLAVLAALSFFTGNEIVAQTNVGAACGCPSVGSRTAMNVQTYAASLNKWSALPASAYGGEITGNITLTCDKIWTIDQKIYVASGATLTIEPGTVVKSTVAGSAAAATALIIERGGKIMAAGSESCPIIFTATADALDGSYGASNKGQWGGILLLGKATNNLTLAANGPFIPGTAGKLAVANGLGVVEGFASSLPQDQFGVAVGSIPTGYAQGTSPTGNYTFTGTGGSAQNNSGATTLKVTAAPTFALAGQTITGTGIAANTTVTGSTTSLTLSNAATANLSGSYTVATTQGGTGTTASTALTLDNSNALILVGMKVTGTGVAANTTVTAINGTAVTLSAASTAAMTGTYTFAFTYTAADVLNFTGSAKITLASALPYVMSGTAVSGTGIPANTTVSAVSGSTITLSASASAPVTGTLTFTGVYPNPGATAYFPIVTTGTSSAPAGLAANGTDYVNYAGVSISQAGQAFDDNDNSGVMTYVSIRYSGAVLLVGSEINGLTLASVGRGTKIEHVEIVSCADDNIEIFGGTVNLKYCTTMFGNDDMFDYDLGWTGKAQFLFGMKANEFTTLGGSTTSGISNDSDNGFEADSDDSQSYNFPRSIPVIYNATLIGNEKFTGNSDNSGVSAIMAKENTGGEIYNSLFANFRNGFNMKKSLGTASSYAAGGEAWHNWTNSPSTPTTSTATTGNGTQILKVKCNTFMNNVTNGVAASFGASISATGTALTGADLTQFTTTDNNIVVTSLTGFDPSYIMNGSTNVITTKNDVVPSPGTNVQLGSGCAQAPFDGFFEPANYRGAFKPSANNENWLSDWTFSQVLNSTKGVLACPTDINNDGVTDVNDFLIFSGQFGQSCN